MKLMLHACRGKRALGKDVLYSDFHHNIRCSHWTVYLLTVVADKITEEFFSSAAETVADDQLRLLLITLCLKCDQVFHGLRLLKTTSRNECNLTNTIEPNVKKLNSTGFDVRNTLLCSIKQITTVSSLNF